MPRFFALFIFLFAFSVHQAQARTLDTVWERGELRCGVDELHYGFAYLNENGEWRGFEVDFCRAIATAVLGDPDKVRFIPLNAQTRFSALKDGDIDVLLRSTTWTYTRDASYGFDFPGVTFYDHLAILAHKSIGATKLSQVFEGVLCVAAGTTTHESVREYVAATKKAIKIKVFNSREGLNNFFFSGQCDLYAADHSALTAVVQSNAPKPEEYVYLETSLSKEPLGPVVREDDREWFDIVKWVVFGLIEAEEREINMGNVEVHKRSENSSVRFMLGKAPGIGKPLRLSDTWLADIIQNVGNYGEIFDRNLGAKSELKMERGINALWSKGGLMYSMPIR